MRASDRLIVWCRRLAVMTHKELLQLFRDIPLMGFLVYSFTLSVYVTGNGIQTQLKNAGLLVSDADQSASSRELISRFHPRISVSTASYPIRTTDCYDWTVDGP